MFKITFLNFFKYIIIIIFPFCFFSCEENKSLVLDPSDNIEYEFKVFKLDADNSNSFRIDEFNSGDSPRLYVGNIEDIDIEGNVSIKKSYIYLKIKNELISNSLFCDEEIVDLNNIQLKLPTLSNTEDLYFSQFYDYNNLLDCSTIIEESECLSIEHCYWYEQLDDYSNEILAQCNFDSIQNIGDQEHMANNSLSAYLLQDSFSNCELLTEDDSSIHSENFIDECSLDDAIRLPVSVSGSYDYLTIDLMGYLYSTIDNSLIDEEAGCTEMSNQSACIANNNCYWIGSPSLGNCEYESYTNIETNLSAWCEGSEENIQDDIVIILEYNPISSNPSMQLLELYSSNESYLYNNPYIYLNYNKEEIEQEPVNKYEITAINSTLIENFLCAEGDCQNFNSNSETWGTVLSFDLGMIQNYLNLTDDNPDNDNSDLIDCSDIVEEENCNEYTFCVYNQNIQECELNLVNPYSSLITQDYEGELFQFDIEISDDYNDQIDDINFYLNNIAFIYLEEDPSNDNYNADSNEEGTENNFLWDWNDINDNQELDILIDEYEKFDDFGLDSCNDEYERGNTWNDDMDECSDNVFLNKVDCLCAVNVEESLYNIEGTENNLSLDWEDLDENNVWSNYEEGEKWYDLGYDLVDDNFESGCFNEDNSYGGKLVCWVEGNQENTDCSYENILLEWQEENPDSSIDDLDIYPTVINGFEISICGGLHWDGECNKCSLNDPNGDNYNIDPAEDDYDEDLDIGEEDNGMWDGVENGDGICDVNECEKFFDYGLDGLPDIYENYSDDVPDDNYHEETNPEGTEGNGIWDYKDMNANDEFDIEYDLYEPFFDDGIDQLRSSDEIGENGEIYNSTGRQNDLSYNIYNSNIREKFDDCGLDGNCDDGDISDDYNSDPNNDNFDIDSNPNGSENDGLLTWEDLVEDGIWTNSDEGEQWYDWGYDHLQNSDENNFMGNYANLALGNNNYSFLLSNESTDFDKPTTNSDDELILWISNISKLDNEENKYRVTLNVHALIDIIAFQLKLEHDPLITEVTNINDNTMLIFPHEFIDNDNNLFPSQSELVEEGEQYIIDASIYTLNNVTNYLSINSAYGIKDSLNFIASDDVSLENFLEENNNSIISDQYTNLVLYFDNSKINHYLFDEVKFQIEYFDKQLDEFVVFSDIQLTENSIYDEVDSIKIDIGPLVQKYIVNELDYENIIIGVSNANHNFSNILIIDNEENYSPRLEIFYSK